MIIERCPETDAIVTVDGNQVPVDYQTPNLEAYEKATKHVHQWLTYISPALREIWPSFEDEQKAAIAANAESQADNEQWE